MATSNQVLVRDIDIKVINHLKARAKKNDRSFEAEIRSILKEASKTVESVVDRQELSRKIRKLHKNYVALNPSTVMLIREDRDR